MREVTIRISTGGEDVSVTVAGGRQEKLGGVAGSENDKRMMQDQIYSKLMCKQCASAQRSESNEKSHFSWCTYFLVLYEK